MFDHTQIPYKRAQTFIQELSTAKQLILLYQTVTYHHTPGMKGFEYISPCAYGFNRKDSVGKYFCKLLKDKFNGRIRAVKVNICWSEVVLEISAGYHESSSTQRG